MVERTENNISYNVFGSGEQTIVLLRGLARWSNHWLGFDQQLSAQGFRVITIDNRGFGRSSTATFKSSMSLHDLADDVSHIISREAPGGAHIVGLSLGGMIGLVLAATKPQQVRSLMLVNSSVGGTDLPRISTTAIFAILRALLTGSKGYERLAGVLLGAKSPSDRQQSLATSWWQIDSQTGVSAVYLWRQLMAARRFKGFLEMRSVQCPVSIVRCDQDQFVDPRNSDFIHKQIPHSELFIHEKSGHELAVDDPVWFIEAIRKSIAKAEDRYRLT